jgi:hypothetical protein
MVTIARGGAVTPKEAIHKVWHILNANIEEVEYQQREYPFVSTEELASLRAEYDAIVAVLNHYLTPRTKPPTVEEVGDSQKVLVVQKDGFVGLDYGDSVRSYWHVSFDAWLPLLIEEPS